MQTPVALTIAGSDSSGGAGIQADLKTFAAFGVYGASVITALTAQNTRAVRAILDVDPAFVAAQLDAVMEDLDVRAAKTGMLARAAIIEVLSSRLQAHRPPHLVIDPVIVATSGATLLEPAAVSRLKELLLPGATLVTPNLDEAELLTGRRVSTKAEMRDAGRALVGLGAQAALVKGGHLKGDAVDILYDGTTFSEFTSPRVQTATLHGTGCTLSAAITAGLARGDDLAGAVASAKRFVTHAIATAAEVGKAARPLNHHIESK